MRQRGSWSCSTIINWLPIQIWVQRLTFNTPDTDVTRHHFKAFLLSRRLLSFQDLLKQNSRWMADDHSHRATLSFVLNILPPTLLPTIFTTPFPSGLWNYKGKGYEMVNALVNGMQCVVDENRHLGKLWVRPRFLPKRNCKETVKVTKAEIDFYLAGEENQSEFCNKGAGGHKYCLSFECSHLSRWRTQRGWWRDEHRRAVHWHGCMWTRHMALVAMSTGEKCKS